MQRNAVPEFRTVLEAAWDNADLGSKDRSCFQVAIVRPTITVDIRIRIVADAVMIGIDRLPVIKWKIIIDVIYAITIIIEITFIDQPVQVRILGRIVGNLAHIENLIQIAIPNRISQVLAFVNQIVAITIQGRVVGNVARVEHSVVVTVAHTIEPDLI